MPRTRSSTTVAAEEGEAGKYRPVPEKTCRPQRRRWKNATGRVYRLKHERMVTRPFCSWVRLLPAGGSFLVVAGKTEGTAFPNPSPCGSSAEIHVAGPTGNSRWCSPGTEPSGLSCGTKAKKTGDGICCKASGQCGISGCTGFRYSPRCTVFRR